MHVLHLFDEALERIGLYFGGTAQLVLVAQQVLDLRIEHLPGKAARLLQHNAPVFGVRVIAKIGALVYKALTFRIHHDAERIAVAITGVR